MPVAEVLGTVSIPSKAVVSSDLVAGTFFFVVPVTLTGLVSFAVVFALPVVSAFTLEVLFFLVVSALTVTGLPFLFVTALPSLSSFCAYVFPFLSFL